MARIPPKIGSFERNLVIALAAGVDFGKFLMGITVFLGILGLFLFIFCFFSLHLYFLIRLGPSYLFSGKNGGQKVAVFFLTTAIGLVPELDDFVPELTIQAANILLNAKKERDEYEAANDNQPQSLSRAA